MSVAKLNVLAAIEPPAGLHEVSPSESMSLLGSGDATACVLADPSGSWGAGHDAARLALLRFSSASAASTDVETLARRLEQEAFRAQEELSQRDEDADTLFAATLLLARGRTISCAWAGDVLALVCDASRVRWLNYPNQHTARTVANAMAAARPVDWYPGLLGCTRAQRGANLLQRADDDVLSDEQALLLLSESVWSHLDEATIVNEVRRAAGSAVSWQCALHETLLRIAKARGAKGHRAAVTLWLGPAAREPVRSRRFGYRAVAVQRGAATGYAIEELHSGREVIVVDVPLLRADLLDVAYRIVSQDLNRATARALLFELLLEGLLVSRFRSQARNVSYRDLASGSELTIPYGWPE